MTNLISEDALNVYKLYRERIVQEDNLINHRMMWTVVSQAFLFALWGASFNALKTEPILLYFVLFIIESTGLVGAYISSVSITAAQKEMAELQINFLAIFKTKNIPKGFEQKVEKLRREKKEIDHLDLIPLEPREDFFPSLIGSKDFHRLGHLMPVAIPWVIASLWAALILLTIARLGGFLAVEVPDIVPRFYLV